MKQTFLAVVAFIGVLAFLVLFISDREMQAGIERLSHYRFSPRSTLDAGDGLLLAGSHSRYGVPPQASDPASEQ